VPDVGDLANGPAASLFDLNVGQISGPINTGNTGVVAKIDDKQQPSPADIAKNLDSTRDSLLNQRRDQMYEVFVSDLVSKYEKAGRVLLNRKAQQQRTPLT